MPVWSPELVVDEPLVVRLLSQFPELEMRSLRRLAEGWDNSVWLVDERYAFRFPHREIAIPGFHRELEVLPKLPALPLAVPRPVFVGQSTDEFPWPFFGSELFPGVEAGDAQLGDAERVDVGVSLARFLRELHAVELDLALPLDANRRTDMARRATLARNSSARSSGSAAGARRRGSRSCSPRPSGSRSPSSPSSSTATSTSVTCSSTAAR